VTDIVDPTTRSRMMSAIRGRDTKPELAVRKTLHAKGFRYVLGGRGLPGSPDLVFPSRSIAVFVHGCFWHRHASCRFAYLPKSRTEFWSKKFDVNVRRDLDKACQLEQLGWQVVTVWECELRSDQTATIDSLCARLNSIRRVKDQLSGSGDAERRSAWLP
jgi:DNA mismatch endonuclease, patch repair protein